MSRIECNGAAGDRDPVQNIVDWTRPVTSAKGPVLVPVTERPGAVDHRVGFAGQLVVQSGSERPMTGDDAVLSIT
jgi:hypothetical protein